LIPGVKGVGGGQRGRVLAAAPRASGHTTTENARISCRVV
jgi:hypothetical protein